LANHRLTRVAYRALVPYAGPGNVCELNKVCRWLMTHASPGAWIDVDDIRVERPASDIRGSANHIPTLISRTRRPPTRSQCRRSGLVLCSTGSVATAGAPYARRRAWEYPSRPSPLLGAGAAACARFKSATRPPTRRTLTAGLRAPPKHQLLRDLSVFPVPYL